MFESALSSLSGASPVFAASGQGKRFVYVRSVLLDVSAVFLQHHPYIGHAAGGYLSALHRNGAAHTGRCAQLAWLVVLGFFFVVHGGSVLRHGLGRKPEIFQFQGGSMSLKTQTSQQWSAAQLARLEKEAVLQLEVTLPLISGPFTELASLAQVLIREPFETAARLRVVDVSRLPSP